LVAGRSINGEANHAIDGRIEWRGTDGRIACLFGIERRTVEPVRSRRSRRPDVVRAVAQGRVCRGLRVVDARAGHTEVTSGAATAAGIAPSRATAWGPCRNRIGGDSATNGAVHVSRHGPCRFWAIWEFSTALSRRT